MAEARGAPEDAAALDGIAQAHQVYSADAHRTFEQAGATPGGVALTDAQKKLVDLVKTSRKHADELQAKVTAFVDVLDTRGQAVSDAAKADGDSAVTMLVSIAGGGVLVGLVLGYLLATFGVSAPLIRSMAELNRLATGDLAVAITGADRGDECGDVANGLAIFKQTALRAQTRPTDLTAQRERAENERRQSARTLAGTFERTVGGLVGMLSAGAAGIAEARDHRGAQPGLSHSVHDAVSCGPRQRRSRPRRTCLSPGRAAKNLAHRAVTAGGP